jgi:hypothetical protein
MADGKKVRYLEINDKLADKEPVKLCTNKERGVAGFEKSLKEANPRRVRLPAHLRMCA